MQIRFSLGCLLDEALGVRFTGVLGMAGISSPSFHMTNTRMTFSCVHRHLHEQDLPGRILLGPNSAFFQADSKTMATPRAKQYHIEITACFRDNLRHPYTICLTHASWDCILSCMISVHSKNAEIENSYKKKTSNLETLRT